ncbi:hypothetical protein TNCV_4294191 [Trichonephila clavipes]|uniref:Uncharacterized protein n=1 Tax=Trichonephila clavipes TaxID=2585209 RepID=A0A8X6RL40_TRICX|nr:hypothetical protein TNCV_4294191 [Trichonephila clavipes]
MAELAMWSRHRIVAGLPRVRAHELFLKRGWLKPYSSHTPKGTADIFKDPSSASASFVFSSPSEKYTDRTFYGKGALLPTPPSPFQYPPESINFNRRELWRRLLTPLFNNHSSLIIPFPPEPVTSAIVRDHPLFHIPSYQNQKHRQREGGRVGTLAPEVLTHRKLSRTPDPLSICTNLNFVGFYLPSLSTPPLLFSIRCATPSSTLFQFESFKFADYKWAKIARVKRRDSQAVAVGLDEGLNVLGKRR